MISFLPGAWMFAAAGLAAAAVPLVIHLLNRNRFREIDWAAMDFLLEAATRSHSLVRLRDLLLLAVRMAAVALFGLAVARPFLSAGGDAGVTQGPLHAIVVIDNSGSMGRTRLGGETLLDDARRRAIEFIDRLPAGSRISLVPLCGGSRAASGDAFRSREDAVEAVAAIRPVDRVGRALSAIDLAAQAAARVPELPAKRVVFIGDQQATNWPGDAAGIGLGSLDEMQVVAVEPGSRDNSWVESFVLDDGVADVESTASFTAVVRHEGELPRRDVQVTLTVDGADVASETIDLEPGQARELSFAHRFDTAVGPGGLAHVAAVVSITPDDLAFDDSRALSVPVLATVPVVFADQFGARGERPRLNRFGETKAVRTLLAPRSGRDGGPTGLITPRHVQPGEIDDALLEDVKLAVVAGAAGPNGSVEPLRRFVERGGRLVIAAGGDFDPAEWTREAWLDGHGILPAPLGGAFGQLPDDPGRLDPFLLDVASLRDEPLFRLAGLPEEEFLELYETPIFFRAVETDVAAGEAAAAEVAAAERETAASSGDPPGEDDRPQPEDSPPRVLARFTGGQPFIVAKRIGAGEVVWIASGLFSSWNTLPKTNAVLVLDRLLRGLLADALPGRTIDTAAAFTLPIAAADRAATIRLGRPDGSEETLPIEALGGDAYGVRIRDVADRGVYTLTASTPDLADGDRRPLVAWRIPIAANGPPRESLPALLDEGSFAERFREVGGLGWVPPGGEISLAGARTSGHDSWRWLLWAVLACLLLEWWVLAAQQAAAAPRPAPDHPAALARGAAA